MWNLLLALPELIKLINRIADLVEQLNKAAQARREEKHQQAVDKVQQSETEQEQLDAAKEYLRNP